MNNSPLADSGTLEIWLTRAGPYAQWFLANSRIRYRTHSNRMTLDSPIPIAEVAHREVAILLQERLASVDSSTVFSDSDFRLNLPGLALHGLRVLTHVANDGAASASVRFVHTLGDIDGFFRAPYGGALRSENSVEDMTVPVLHDLLLPALEVFDHILDHGLTDDQAKLLAARVKTMRSRRDELSDYISLLTQYIESARALETMHATDTPEALSGSKPPDLPSLGPTLPPSEQHRHLELPPQLCGSGGNDLAHRTRHDSRRHQSLEVQVSSRGRPLRWTPKGGLARGEGLGILHGHHSKSEG
ncbi:hypothetical protein J4E08_06610 [Sagittula sp. NFXS13]|uniref:hypothetical protein n=1 Tax=Sagittula sp. NFXS13 TaxID=2819095 RepID=UPI0032DF95A5